MKNQVKIKIQKGFRGQFSNEWRTSDWVTSTSYGYNFIICDKFIREAISNYPLGSIANLYVVRSEKGLITLDYLKSSTTGYVASIAHNYYHRITKDIRENIIPHDIEEEIVLYQGLERPLKKLFKKNEDKIRVDVYLEIIREGKA